MAGTHRNREHTHVEIQGKKAVVIGGASGMGRATAQALAARGADVAVLDRPTSAGREVAEVRLDAGMRFAPK
jgi:NAD(P)-dependent dehydrogenase (short-subunit alcohol dehydrogenase family)